MTNTIYDNIAEYLIACKDCNNDFEADGETMKLFIDNVVNDLKRN